MTIRLLGFVRAVPSYCAQLVVFSLLVAASVQSQQDVNRQDHFGVTDLMRAARAGDTARVKTLIAEGANVNLA
jgi:ankyrin repeat protein